ncbi:unnamed protein product [Lactuca saligna]|uniref:Thioredoxin domain-containing protein n=1 Tax=Lactuca saligna TaxID=75948 RepID=A0AA35Z8S5_LACSI|nr:unnamed protein product [Lactuca saligna]
MIIAGRSRVVTIESEAEFNTLLRKIQDESLPTVFYFTAIWCGPCRFVSPLIGELSEQYTNVTTYKIGIDQEGMGDALAKLNIPAMPRLNLLRSLVVADPSQTIISNRIATDWPVAKILVSSSDITIDNHLGCGDLVRHVEDMVDNLLIHVQILTLLSPCGHGGSSAVTPGYEAKPHVLAVCWEIGEMENSILSIYDDVLPAHTSDLQRVDEKITAKCEKFLQDYKQRFLQTEALCEYLQQREFEIKKQEQKLLKDKRKLELKKRAREVSSCKQLVNECYSSRKAAEGLKREIDMLHKRRAELEDKLKAENFEVLQSEIMQLEMAIQVIEDDEREPIDLEEKLKNSQSKLIQKDEQLQELKEQLQELKDRVNTVCLAIQRKNDEMQDARQELIHGLEMYPYCSYVGIKTMGVVDSMPFYFGCHLTKKTRKETKKNPTNLLVKCRKLVEDQNWHPFKVGSDEKEIIDEENEEMVRLKAECSEEQYHAVVTALKERNEYEINGKHPVQELWNYKEKRKASLKEGIDCILEAWKIHKHQ